MGLAISLDLSTKPGWAIFKREENIYKAEKDLTWERVDSGTLFPDKEISDFGTYPENYVEYSKYIIDRLLDFIASKQSENGLNVDWDTMIFIVEETTPGRNNYAQRILEFLHFYLIESLMKYNSKIVYLRTGSWKSIVSAKQTKEEQKKNAKIARIKKKTGKKLAKDESGKVMGRITRKHVSVRVANQTFGLNLILKNEDEADALNMAQAYLNMNCPIADGTVKGGLIIKDK
jgi:hypothetical protein